MGLVEKVKLLLDTKAFEQGITRAKRKFNTFAERGRRAIGGGRGAKKGAGGIEALTKGGGILSAVAGGFGATAAVRTITQSIQGMSDFLTQQMKDRLTRLGGPAGSFSAELASRGASQIQSRKIIFGLTDAFNGLGAAVLGNKGALEEWTQKLIDSANVTDTFAEGQKLIVIQERNRLQQLKSQLFRTTFAAERRGEIGKFTSAELSEIIQGLHGTKEATRAMRNLTFALENNLRISGGTLTARNLESSLTEGWGY